MQWAKKCAEAQQQMVSSILQASMLFLDFTGARYFRCGGFFILFI